jgi:hypothetical protein
MDEFPFKKGELDPGLRSGIEAGQPQIACVRLQATLHERGTVSAMLLVRYVLHILPALRLYLSEITFGVVTVAGLSWYVYSNRRPDPQEVERQRRMFLAQRGRITDATLIDTRLDQRFGGDAERGLPAYEAEGESPQVLQYQYKVGGVGYESVQDISLFAENVRHLRIDKPIQVRYDPNNPGNSIVVAESWSGLRLDR